MNAFHLRQRTLIGEIASPARERPTIHSYAISNDTEGLRVLVNRMVDQTREFSADPLVVRTSRMIAQACWVNGSMPADKQRIDCSIANTFHWLKANFMYLNDPVGKEVVVSPVRMIKDLETPPNVLEAVLGPVLKDQVLGTGRFALRGDESLEMSKVGIRGCFG